MKTVIRIEQFTIPDREVIAAAWIKHEPGQTYDFESVPGVLRCWRWWRRRACHRVRNHAARGTSYVAGDQGAAMKDSLHIGDRQLMSARMTGATVVADLYSIRALMQRVSSSEDTEDWRVDVGQDAAHQIVLDASMDSIVHDVRLVDESGVTWCYFTVRLSEPER